MEISHKKCFQRTKKNYVPGYFDYVSSERYLASMWTPEAQHFVGHKLLYFSQMSPKFM